MPRHTPRLFFLLKSQYLDAKAYTKAVCLFVEVAVSWDDMLLDARAYTKAVFLFC
jgi:hypothetical protein